MDARQLRYFLSVVDHGSIRRAADTLFVAQPSISQTLRTLERDLGTPLFHRVGRRLVLTASGERLVEPARQVMRWLELARARVGASANLEGGRLVIATMPSQSVSPLTGLIQRFTTQHPQVQVSVRAAGTPPSVRALLRTGDAELGLIAAAHPESPDDDITLHPIETQRFILVTRDAAEPPEPDPVHLADLCDQRLVVGQPGTGMRRVADAILAVSPGSRAVVEVENRAAILPLVLAGVGSAVLSESWRDLARTAGASVRDLHCEEALHVALAHRPGPLSPAAATFLALAVMPTEHDRQGLSAE